MGGEGRAHPAYAEVGGKAHVWMVPLGENAWQSAIERWLDGQEVVAP